MLLDLFVIALTGTIGVGGLVFSIVGPEWKSRTLRVVFQVLCLALVLIAVFGVWSRLLK
jgi:hypothetical protein